MRMRVPAMVGALLVAGCSSFDVPDLNDPGLEDFESDPTRAKLAAAATGLLMNPRAEIGRPVGYISFLGIFGRESYNLDPADDRSITELLIGPIRGDGFGAFLWASRYNTIRLAKIVMGVLDRVPGLTVEEQNATRGFAETIYALELLGAINTRDVLGAPLDVNDDPADRPLPIASKAEVFAHIVALLDSAKTDLEAGGGSFPFPLSAGYADFDAPASFLKFNRALRARVAVYSGDFTGTLAALTESFLDPTGPLMLGAYYSYGTGAGDRVNRLYDPEGRSLLAHPSIETDAQLRADGTKDLRFQGKLVRVAPQTLQGITSDLAFTIYNSPSAPIPIIRNEELILLRAEANMALGNLTDAIADLNLIRISSGGLPPYAGPVTPEALLDELLYNRRYSLLWEGHRWIDLRRYGRLATLPLDLPNHHRFEKMPFPTDDCAAYSPPPSAGCSPEVGF
jgi:starch-binding outer membrane protein, SusD/RagB family